MVKKLLLLALAVPAAYGTAVLLHPGIALDVTPLAKLPQTDLAGSYTVDAWHTSVGFEIAHLGLSRVQGRFDKVSGKFSVDPRNVGKSSVSFTVQTDSVDTNVAPRDADLRSKNYFDVETYPTITFSSTKVRKAGRGYVATGDLTIHGVTKSVEIPFEAHGPAIVGGQFGTRIGVVSEPLRISRLTYGVGPKETMNGTLAVGDEVTIKLSVEATKDQ